MATIIPEALAAAVQASNDLPGRGNPHGLLDLRTGPPKTQAEIDEERLRRATQEAEMVHRQRDNAVKAAEAERAAAKAKLDTLATIHGPLKDAAAASARYRDQQVRQAEKAQKSAGKMPGPNLPRERPVQSKPGTTGNLPMPSSYEEAAGLVQGGQALNEQMGANRPDGTSQTMPDPGMRELPQGPGTVGLPGYGQYTPSNLPTPPEEIVTRQYTRGTRMEEFAPGSRVMLPDVTQTTTVTPNVLTAAQHATLVENQRQFAASFMLQQQQARVDAFNKFMHVMPGDKAAEVERALAYNEPLDMRGVYTFPMRDQDRADRLATLKEREFAANNAIQMGQLSLQAYDIALKEKALQQQDRHHYDQVRVDLIKTYREEALRMGMQDKEIAALAQRQDRDIEHEMNKLGLTVAFQDKWHTLEDNTRRYGIDKTYQSAEEDRKLQGYMFERRHMLEWRRFNLEDEMKRAENERAKTALSKQLQFIDKQMEEIDNASKSRDFNDKVRWASALSQTMQRERELDIEILKINNAKELGEKELEQRRVDSERLYGAKTAEMVYGSLQDQQKLALEERKVAASEQRNQIYADRNARLQRADEADMLFRAAEIGQRNGERAADIYLRSQNNLNNWSRTNLETAKVLIKANPNVTQAVLMGANVAENATAQSAAELSRTLERFQTRGTSFDAMSPAEIYMAGNRAAAQDKVLVKGATGGFFSGDTIGMVSGPEYRATAALAIGMVQGAPASAVKAAQDKMRQWGHMEGDRVLSPDLNPKDPFAQYTVDSAQAVLRGASLGVISRDLWNVYQINSPVPGEPQYGAAEARPNVVPPQQQQRAEQQYQQGPGAMEQGMRSQVLPNLPNTEVPNSLLMPATPQAGMGVDLSSPDGWRSVVPTQQFQQRLQQQQLLEQELYRLMQGRGITIPEVPMYEPEPR